MLFAVLFRLSSESYSIVLRGEIFIEGRIYNRVLEGRGLLPVNIRQGIVFPGIAVRGENLMGERIYNGVGGSLIVGANYFSAPGGLLPLKSRRGEIVIINIRPGGGILPVNIRRGRLFWGAIL